jgi:hypothetical protein
MGCTPKSTGAAKQGRFCEIKQMGLRRIAAGDQRRRRVLIEESLNLSGASTDFDRDRPPMAWLAVAQGTSYSDAALLGRQPPSVAVLAACPFTLTVTALGVLVLLVGLLAAYAHWALWPPQSLPATLFALDLQRPGSLAAWIGSLLLSAAAFQGIQIYRLRRHKTDDYRGRYRVWAWFPLVLVVMAAGQATGFHRDVIRLFSVWLGPQTGSFHKAAWPMIAAVSWVLVAARLTLEIRASRWATALLAMATVGYTAGLVTAQISVQPISQLLVVLFSSAFLLTSHLGVFVSVLLFGRHVYLDSQGLLPVRTAKVRRAKAQAEAAPRKRLLRCKAADVAEAEGSEGRTEATVEEEPQRRPESSVASLAEETAKGPEGTASEEQPDSADAPVLRWQSDRNQAGKRDAAASGEMPEDRLSKTERRRLKKQRQQEQLRRAA